MDKDSQDESVDQRKSAGRMPGAGLVIPLLIVAVVAGLWLFNSASQPKRTRIPFSFFVEQLKAKNVEEVELGSRIALGKFRMPPELPDDKDAASDTKGKSDGP